MLWCFIKMGRMHEEQAEFEQSIVSDFKRWSSTALKGRPHVWDKFWKLKPFKNDEKCFLFHLKSSSGSYAF